MTFRRIGHGRHHGERAERYPAVAAGVCPGRSAGRLPGRSAGSLDLPGHLPPVTGASAQVSGEMYLGGDPGLMTTSSHSHARGAGTGARTKDEAAVLAASGHLTDRDRDLVRLVAVHRVLATSQLAALGFRNITTARHRLSVLVRLGLLRRFRPHTPTGSAPWHYVLGPVGAAMLGVEDREETRWLPHVRADRQLSLERSPRLTHMTGRNWFFVALARDARAHGGELREWLNEADTAARYENAAVRQDDRARLPHPDGAGTWAEDGRAASFLLEYDTGTEHLPVLAGKLDGYQVLAAGLPGTGRSARSCCSASAPRAGSRAPAAHWPPPGRPPTCGSPPPRSTRASPARPGRYGCRC